MSRNAQRTYASLSVHSLFSPGADTVPQEPNHGDLLLQVPQPQEQQYENLTPTAENDHSVAASLNLVMDTFEEVHMASLVTCVLF